MVLPSLQQVIVLDLSDHTLWSSHHYNKWLCLIYLTIHYGPPIITTSDCAWPIWLYIRVLPSLQQVIVLDLCDHTLGSSHHYNKWLCLIYLTIHYGPPIITTSDCAWPIWLYIRVLPSLQQVIVPDLSDHTLGSGLPSLQQVIVLDLSDHTLGSSHHYNKWLCLIYLTIH